MAEPKFKIEVASRQAVIAQERLYLTADRKRVVKHGDKDAAFLFAAVGQPIYLTDAKKYGLVADEPKAAEPGKK